MKKGNNENDQKLNKSNQVAEEWKESNPIGMTADEIFTIELPFDWSNFSEEVKIIEEHIITKTKTKIVYRVPIDNFDGGSQLNLPLETELNNPESPKPPAFMILVAGLTLDTEQRMTRLDYIEERFAQEAEKHGFKAAKMWLLRDVIYSLGPDAYDFGRKAFIRLLKVLGVAELIRRFWGGG